MKSYFSVILLNCWAIGKKMQCIEKKKILIIYYIWSKNIKKYGDSNKQCNYNQITKYAIRIKELNRIWGRKREVVTSIWTRREYWIRKCLLCEVQCRKQWSKLHLTVAWELSHCDFIPIHSHSMYLLHGWYGRWISLLRTENAFAHR